MLEFLIDTIFVSFGGILFQQVVGIPMGTLDQGYKKIRLIRSLKKVIFRYQDLVEIYSVSAEKIINDENV
jgi:hypothetical protein